MRFIVLEIIATGVLLFECFFSSRRSCEVHARRLAVLAMLNPPLLNETRVYQMRVQRAQAFFVNNLVNLAMFAPTPRLN